MDRKRQCYISSEKIKPIMSFWIVNIKQSQIYTSQRDVDLSPKSPHFTSKICFVKWTNIQPPRSFALCRFEIDRSAATDSYGRFIVHSHPSWRPHRHQSEPTGYWQLCWALQVSLVRGFAIVVVRQSTFQESYIYTFITMNDMNDIGPTKTKTDSNRWCLIVPPMGISTVSLTIKVKV